MGKTFAQKTFVFVRSVFAHNQKPFENQFLGVAYKKKSEKFYDDSNK